MRLFLALCAVVFAAGIVSAADKLWSVPGIVNTTGLATVISCTNGDGIASTVEVTVIDVNAGACGLGNASIAPGESHSFATQGVAFLSGETNLSACTINGGWGQIIGGRDVFCTAYVVDPSNNPPSAGWQLNIVSKARQRGD